MAQTNNSIDKPLDKAPTVKEALMIAEKDPMQHIELELMNALERAFKEAQEQGFGGNFKDWIKTKDLEELKELAKFKDGGNVVSLSDYLKQKEPIKIKQLDLASQFTPGKTLASLTPSEREKVNMLLKLTLGKQD